MPLTLQVTVPDDQLPALAAALESFRSEPEHLTAIQAAERLGVSERTVRAMVKDGRLPRVPGLHHIRIPREAIK